MTFYYTVDDFSYRKVQGWLLFLGKGFSLIIFIKAKLSFNDFHEENSTFMAFLIDKAIVDDLVIQKVNRSWSKVVLWRFSRIENSTLMTFIVKTFIADEFYYRTIHRWRLFLYKTNSCWFLFGKSFSFNVGNYS